MRTGAQFLCIILIAVVISLSISPHAIAKRKIRLVTSEREPYIGENISGNGYVHELVTEVFRRMGYDVEIAFYPLARANLLAEQGAVDGIMPVYYDESLNSTYVFSDPFPGDTVGLLKRKAMGVEHAAINGKSLTATIQNLNAHTFGMLRGAIGAPEFDQIEAFKVEVVTNDLQNIEKLSLGRIDFVIIDKYTAADIMVNHAPYLIGHLEFVHTPFIKKTFHVAFSRKSHNYEQMREDFDRGLEEVIADKTISSILYRHGLLEPKMEGEGKIVIRIAAVDNPDIVIMKRLSKEYEKRNPNVRLEWKLLDENILRLRLMSDIAISDGKVDVMAIGAYETPIWAERGWILPIENLPDSYDRADILKPVLDVSSYNESLFALPFYAESSVTFYRKDLFVKAGIKMPAVPTYDDIARFAAKIHDVDNGVYGVCFRGKPGWGENMAFLTIMVNAFGGRWFDEQWHPELNSSEWHDAIHYYKNILDEYGPPNATSNGFTENLSLFADGRCGIWIDASVAAGLLFNPKMSKVAKNVGLAASPVAKTSKGSQWLWSWGFAIPSSSRIPNEALKFISWATSKEYIRIVAEREGWVSAPPGTRLSTYKNRNYQAEAPFAAYVLSAIQSANIEDNTLKATPYNGIQYVGIPEFPSLGASVGHIISKMIDADRPIDHALNEAQELVYGQMRLSGYLN